MSNQRPKNNLKLLRKEKNYSQDTIAKMLKVDIKTYRSWEKGYTAPDVDMLIILSDIYGVSIDFLLGRSQFRHVENKFISNKINLSESSIEHLENSPWFEHVLLDTLLSKGWFLEKICKAIYEYMEIRYKKITFTDSSTNYNKSLSDDEKQAIAEFEATKLFSSLLTDDIANDPKIKELSEHEHLFETIDFDKCSNRFQENLEKAAKDKHMTAKQYTKEFFAKHKNNK